MERPAPDDSLPGFLLEQGRALVADLQSREAPVTTWLLVLVALVFGQQAAVAWRTGASIEAVASHLFVEYTAWAWLLSAFLHRSVLHVLANVAIVLVLGRVVEDRIARSEYLVLLVVAGVASTVGGVLFTAPFVDVPVAVYGASGLGYALATVSLWLPAASAGSLRAAYRPAHLLDSLEPAEELAVLVGVAAVLHVALDVATGPYRTAQWVNGGHAVGALVGLLAGAWQYR